MKRFVAGFIVWVLGGGQFIFHMPSPPASPCNSSIYETSFPLNENPISEGGCWHHLDTTLQTVRTELIGGVHVAHGNQTGSDGFDDANAYLSGFPLDQSIEGVVWKTGSTDIQEIELLLRWSDDNQQRNTAYGPTSAEGYEINVSLSGSYMNMGRFKGDLLTSTSIATPVTGDVFEVTITTSGANAIIKAYWNGVEKLSYTDTTPYTKGNPGIGFYVQDAPNNQYGFSRVRADGCSAVSNGTVSDTQTKINAATTGQSVCVPAGSYTWSSGLTINNKAITLKSLGPVTITCGTDTADLISITEATAGITKVDGFTFESSTCLTNSASRHFIRVFTAANGRPALIVNNTFSGGYGAIRMDTNKGVIAANTFTATWGGVGQYNTVEALQMKCEAACDSIGWGAGSTLGSLDTTGENNVYFEDNIINEHNTETIDFDGSSRTVVRYNTFNQSAITSHGNDTGPYGARQWELYNNTFTFSNPSTNCSTLDLHGAMDYFIFIRGGTGVITDNSIADINSCYTGNKSELKFADLKLTQSTGQVNSCWNSGYPSPRQHGMGRITGAAGNDPSGIYKGDSDPIYIWGNTGGWSSTPSMVDWDTDQCGNGNTTAAFVQLNRDFFLSAKSGYTKYTYPHPLRSQ